MTLITPAGNSNFNWSPKESGLTKTASKGSKEMSDKDILYAAAKKVVQAQMAIDEAEETDLATIPEDGMGEGKMPCGPCEGKDGIVPEMGPSAGPSAMSPKPSAGADAVQVVQELADKANKAEEQAANVEQALGKVEEAVQGVRDAVGTVDAASPAGAPDGEGAVPEEVVLDVEVEDDGEEEVEVEVEIGDEKGEKGEEKEIEVEVEDDGEKEVEVEVEDEKGDKGEKEEKEDGEKDEMVKESIEAKNKAVEMKTAGETNDLVKTSKLSPCVRNKIYKYYKDILGYDGAYAKLMTTDYEK